MRELRRHLPDSMPLSGLSICAVADRVVVMSPRPGRVSGIVEVGIERPRVIEAMHEATFTDLVFQVRDILGGGR